MNFRSCGNCVVCCDGFLIGNSYGNVFGCGISCAFLVDKKCAIYEDRPNACRKFECAWTQKILPEWMKPNLCGVLVSVEIDTEKKQYLRVIEIKNSVDHLVYDEIAKFCQLNNTYYVKVPYENSR